MNILREAELFLTQRKVENLTKTLALRREIVSLLKERLIIERGLGSLGYFRSEYEEEA